MVPPNVTAPEITGRALIFGLVMNIIFSVAATFLALKAGQGIETAIPISILAVGMSGLLVKMRKRGSSILENVYILAFSTTSGYVAGGTCFTMPAIYILNLNKNLEMGTLSLFLQIALVPLLGSILGVLFIIPFRRYFVKEMHGKLPFPEATATNEILVTGGSGSASQAWILIYSFLLAAVYNFVSVGLKLFGDVFTTGLTKLHSIGKVPVETPAFASQFFDNLTNKIKAVITMGTGAYYLGLGFIIGLRYASIICAGSFLSCLVIVPLLGRFDIEQLRLLNPEVESAAAEHIWIQIPRIVGIGTIFTAGLLSIIKMSKVIVTALSQALGGLLKSGGTGGAHDRTDEDVSYRHLLILGALTIVTMVVFFRYVVMNGMENAGWLTFVSIILALVIAFLFTTVSAWAIAMISVTPISGMTVTTIIITAVLLSMAGLPKGDKGMLATLLVGGVVCTALSMAGGLITNFKLGYWVGASPKKIAWNAIAGAVVSAVFVAATIMILADKPGYVDEGALPAPQANMMAGALQSFLGTGQVPWLLYGLGVVVALLVELIGISALAFGLGMYLPMHINTPILIGALVATLVKKSTKNAGLAKARSNRGILIASGLIAGAAIIEVLLNFLAIIDEKVWGVATIVGGKEKTIGKIMHWLDVSGRLIDGGINPQSLARFANWFGLVMFIALCAFVYWDCLRAKPDEDAPEIHM